MPPMNYVFLAGSIDMGKAEDWQTWVANYFVDKDPNNRLGLISPRRDHWDNSWEQSLDNIKFFEQVNWEYNYLSLSHHIFMNLLPESKSPISLLELGMFADSGRMIVTCPKGFWRKGNVDYVCKRYNIPEFESLNDSLPFLKSRLFLE